MQKSGGTDFGLVMFHIIMTLVTAGGWLAILVIWWIIKAASQR